jgi:hypothetical protein
MFIARELIVHAEYGVANLIMVYGHTGERAPRSPHRAAWTKVLHGRDLGPWHVLG